MATSQVVRLHYEELFFYAACVCNCWGLFLCMCVLLEGGCSSGASGGGGGMRLASSWRWRLSRAMRLVLRLCYLCPRKGRSNTRTRPGSLGGLWRYTKLLLKSLRFNSLHNSDTLLDSVFEPVYWIVDNVTLWFGVVFVTLVILLTSSVLVIVYLCVLPIIISTYPVQWIIWHVCYGHWLLVMVLFHYYKATTTSPGHPPKERKDIPSVSVCKKCIIPKPARTHHCSICNVCIFKMDHHCPWLNNCVGHFNHRYFFSFCMYMTLGCIYCSVSCKEMFYEAYGAVERYRSQEAAAQLRTETVTGLGLILSLLHAEEMKGHLGQSYYQTPPPTYTFRETMMHKSVIFVWVLTSSVAVALGGLTLWHAILISKGETSIERHINRKEAKRLKEIGKVFTNPYHFGVLNNWRVLFGVEKTSHWLTRVLLPSSHPTQGDGIIWDCIFTRRDPMAI